jgi:outer membrane protein, multidrug efflux system
MKQQRIQMLSNTSGLVILSILLTGCGKTAKESYRAPMLEVQALPESYSDLALADSPMPGETSVDISAWWRQFNDPVLVRLVEQTISANLDIAQAASRLTQARERLGGAGAARLPTLDAALSSNRTVKRPDNDGPKMSYSADFNLGWDPDLFGKLRSSRNAAQADLEAAGYSVATVQRAAVAEVARNYVNYRAYSIRLANAQKALHSQQEILEAVQHRFDSGLAVAVDVEQAKLKLLQVQAIIPQLGQARNEARNRMSILLGRAPGDLGDVLDDRQGELAPLPSSVTFPSMGVPADLIRRRPDILGAERRVLASADRVGVARANLFPQMSLGGSINLASFTMAGLADSLVSSLIARVGQTLFDGGARGAVIREQRAATQEALFAYRASLLSAMEEVENAATAVQSASLREALEQRALESAETSARMARAQYHMGLIDFFIVLDSEQSLLSQRDNLISAQVDRANAIMALYAALGGGWNLAQI